MAELYESIISFIAAKPVVTGVCATAVLGIAWTINDFYDWKSFGSGGTPPTWAGYWRMTKIRIKHTLSGPDLLDSSYLSTDGPSYLKKPLPKRAGDRPKIMPRTMPQRQRPERIDSSTRTKLQSLMKNIGESHPELFEVKPSHTEGRSTDGLYARSDVATLNPLARDKILNHEIAHAHPAENSLHVWLSDPDAKKVIDAGWGQRFPLLFVQRGWTMIYAPRNNEELEVVEQIVKAGAEWITGIAV